MTDEPRLQPAAGKVTHTLKPSGTATEPDLRDARAVFARIEGKEEACRTSREDADLAAAEAVIGQFDSQGGATVEEFDDWMARMDAYEAAKRAEGDSGASSGS